MKYRTVQVREGELLGPVDYSYDFLSHFSGYCCDDAGKRELCDAAVKLLREIEAEPDAFLVTTDGGWPRCGWRPVVAVGMYDGWPFWKPVPSIAAQGTFGVEWHNFAHITGAERKPTSLTKPKPNKPNQNKPN